MSTQENQEANNAAAATVAVQEQQEPQEVEEQVQQPQPRPQPRRSISSRRQVQQPQYRQPPEYDNIILRQQLKTKGWDDETIDGYMRTLYSAERRRAAEQAGVLGLPPPQSRYAMPDDPIIDATSQLAKVGNAVSNFPAEQRGSAMESLVNMLVLNAINKQNNPQPQQAPQGTTTFINDAVRTAAQDVIAARAALAIFPDGPGGKSADKEAMEARLKSLEDKIERTLNEREKSQYLTMLETMQKNINERLDKMEKGGSVSTGDPTDVITNVINNLDKQWEQANKARRLLGLEPLDPGALMGAARRASAPSLDQLAEQLKKMGAEVKLPPRNWQDVEAHMTQKVEEITKKAEEKAAEKYHLHEQRKETLSMIFNVITGMVDNFMGFISEAKGDQTAAKIKSVLTGVRQAKASFMHEGPDFPGSVVQATENETQQYEAPQQDQVPQENYYPIPPEQVPQQQQEPAVLTPQQMQPLEQQPPYLTALRQQAVQQQQQQDQTQQQ